MMNLNQILALKKDILKITFTTNNYTVPTFTTNKYVVAEQT